jgi:hypothetical protein
MINKAMKNRIPYPIEQLKALKQEDRLSSGGLFVLLYIFFGGDARLYLYLFFSSTILVWKIRALFRIDEMLERRIEKGCGQILEFLATC